MDQLWIYSFIFLFVFHKTWSCCNLDAQISLNCFSCNLSAVPADVPEEVRELDLSFNPLKRLYNGSFSRLSQLQVLDLTRCDITSIEDDAFAGLGALHTLILTGNPVKHWSQVTFSGLSSLRKLIIVETSLASLCDLDVGSLPSLQELNVATNSIDRLYVPSSLHHLHALDLRNNLITNISNEDLENLRHANTSNLRLILSQNPLCHIDPGAFRSVTLHLLNLMASFSNEDIMKSNLHGLSGLRVEKLVLGQYRGVERIRFKEDLFEGLCGAEVKELTVAQIYLKQTATFFDCMVNITSLRFIHTNLEQFSCISFTSNMEKFVLKYSQVAELNFCFFTWLRNLKELRITQNKKLNKMEEGSFLNLNKLEVVDLSDNKLMIDSCCSTDFSGESLKNLNLSHNTQAIFRSEFLEMPHLLSLDLSHMRLDTVGMFPLFLNLKNLRYLDVSYTSCHFIIHCSFCGLDNLVELRLSHTTFAPDILGSVFQNMSSLRILDMASCNLGHVPNTMFEHLNGLQVLDLSNNKLKELATSFLISLPALKHFDISENNIQGLSNDVTQVLSKGLMKVDLSQNPYDCSCAQEQFLLWVHEQSSRDLVSTKRLECKTPEHLQGSLLVDVNMNCSWTHVYVSLLVVVVILFLAFVVYHFYLKSCFFFLSFCRQNYRNSATDQFFDAFVIHSSLDENWVRDELIPELENGVPSFKLCLHFRDFEPGKMILENIFYNGICCSRNALVILSPHFIESKWCSFEFRLAMFWKFLENQCGMILILLEPIRDEQLKHMYVLRKHLKCKTYLKWENEDKKKTVFWRRLKRALEQGQNGAAPLLGHNTMDVCQQQNKHNKEKAQCSMPMVGM